MIWTALIVNANEFGNVKLNLIKPCQSHSVQAKIAEEMHCCIFGRHNNPLVNVYHCITGGVNDPYGVKVMK
jgi:hypothetical protein